MSNRQKVLEALKSRSNWWLRTELRNTTQLSKYALKEALYSLEADRLIEADPNDPQYVRLTDRTGL